MRHKQCKSNGTLTKCCTKAPSFRTIQNSQYSYGGFWNLTWRKVANAPKVVEQFRQYVLTATSDVLPSEVPATEAPRDVVPPVSITGAMQQFFCLTTQKANLLFECFSFGDWLEYFLKVSNTLYFLTSDFCRVKIYASDLVRRSYCDVLKLLHRTMYLRMCGRICPGEITWIELSI